jgi:hypothetical protein
VLTWLYRRVALDDPPPGVTLLTTLLIVLIAVFSASALSIYGISQVLTPWFWLVLSTALGFILLRALARVVRRLVGQALPGFSLSPWGRRSLIALMVAVSIPMVKLVDDTRPVATYTSVLSLAYRLDEWLILIWVGGVLVFLHQQGKKGLKIQRLTRTLGVLGVSAYLYNTTARWFYIPVTFLLGWLTLTQWFVGAPKVFDALDGRFHDVVQKRARWLACVLDTRIAERAHREHRKQLSEKLTQGELTLTAYDEQLASSRKQLQTLRDRATQDGQPVRDLVLGFGPYPTAWQNGVHGARFALLFSLPWITLYLRDFLTDPMPGLIYPLWSFGANLSLVLLRWITYGFFLGYFYPYLRGKSGLQKGLGLFLASIGPAIPLMALLRSSATAWQASLFWMLQVFIHCMLLGLVAFDFTILRREGFEWPMLFELHGLPSLGISISSILVAIGAAVTTLLTSQTAELLKVALTFIIPRVPPDALP